MKKSNLSSQERITVILLRGLAIAIVFISQAFMPGDSGTNTLTVTITNIQVPSGIIEIGLYRDAKKFPKVGMQYKKVRKQVTGKTLSCTFSGLENGAYAMAIYHDENSDGECNKNFIGYPTEAYAFSNDYRPFLSEPSFKNCRFWVTEDKSVSVKMVY